MAAVLQAVIEDACKAATRTSAMAYVESRDRLWPFSFENLCEALDMDAGNVRRQLDVTSVDSAGTTTLSIVEKAPLPVS